MTRDDVLQRLTEARLRSYLPAILRWQGQAKVRQRLESETLGLLERTTDERAGRRLMTRFPTPGAADPTAYLDALVPLADDSLALTGIRFRGGDPSKPFVDILAVEGSPTERRLPVVLEAVDARWSLFAPLCVRLSVASADAVRVSDLGPRSRVDLRVIAGRVADIRAVRLGTLDGLEIQVASDMAWYEHYRREYDSFLAAASKHGEWAQPESYESLARATREAALFLVRLHGDLSGIYSMPRGSAHGLSGFRVQEKFLFDSIRGRGLGARVEHAVVKQLPAGRDDVVFGSVEEGNLPSRASAYRLGRVDIATKLWLTPPGRSGMPA